LSTCGGFFDVPSTQKRLAELDALMAADNFWNNREQAQKLIDESNSLRKKIDPLTKAEAQVEDFKVMVELNEGEPEADQLKYEKEMTRELAQFSKDLENLELKVFLNGPHDKNNCILSINSGADGVVRLGEHAVADVSALGGKSRLEVGNHRSAGG
jgi:peptide chain release factor 2